MPAPPRFNPTCTFTREDFDRAWNMDGEPPPPLHAAPTTAIRVHRSSEQDCQKAIRLFIDGEPVGEIQCGQIHTRRVEPGVHTIRVATALREASRIVYITSGQQIHARCGTGTRSRWLMWLLPFLARQTVWLAIDSTPAQ